MEVTKDIFKQYESVQQSGKTNMRDKSSVQKIAYDMEHFELVVFIDEGDYEELLDNYDMYENRWGDDIELNC